VSAVRTAPAVIDWATDFDHTDPVWVDNPFPIWDDLRKRCPIAHSDRYNGVYLPTRHEDVSAIAYDTEHFTSKAVIVQNGEVLAEAPVGGAPPITSDPPFHQHARKLLLPAFGPKVIEALRPMIEQYCHDLIDAMVDDDGNPRDLVDGAIDYAQHLPPGVIAQMLGLPREDGDLFREFIHSTIGSPDAPQEVRVEAFGRLDAYLDEHLQDHVENPRDDLMGFLLNAEIFGQKLPHEMVRGTCVLLLIAGIDTTWSAIGAGLFHLASNDGDRNRLANEASLLPFAVEEVLRAYAPVTMARIVKEDVEINGTLLPTSSSSTGPRIVMLRSGWVFTDASGPTWLGWN
jgi:cytochrome P450